MVEIDSPKIRGTTQILLNCATGFFVFGFLLLGAGAIWSLIGKDNFIVPLILFFGSFLLFLFSIYLFLYSRRYMATIKNRILLFNGFKHRTLLIEQNCRIVIAMAGNSPRSLHMCIFFYHNNVLETKYTLLEPQETDSKIISQYRKKIENQFVELSKKTGCQVEFKWDVAVEFRQWID